jgi:hypothetical protein
LNLRPLGYEHPNRCLIPLPRSPPSLPFAGRLPIGISSIATSAEASHRVLVTGLVTVRPQLREYDNRHSLEFPMTGLLVQEVTLQSRTWLASGW